MNKILEIKKIKYILKFLLKIKHNRSKFNTRLHNHKFQINKCNCPLIFTNICLFIWQLSFCSSHFEIYGLQNLKENHLCQSYMQVYKVYRFTTVFLCSSTCVPIRKLNYAIKSCEIYCVFKKI